MKKYTVELTRGEIEKIAEGLSIYAIALSKNPYHPIFLKIQKILKKLLRLLKTS